MRYAPYTGPQQFPPPFKLSLAYDQTMGTLDVVLMSDTDTIIESIVGFDSEGRLLRYKSTQKIAFKLNADDLIEMIDEGGGDDAA